LKEISMADKQAPSTFPEVLKLHEHLRVDLEAQLEKVKPKRKLTPDELIAMRKADLDRTKAALAEVEKQRDASARAWEERITRLKKRADQQVADIGAAKEAAKEAIKTTPRKSAPAKKEQ
jgi:peptidoglycan hydrolase CwlO-like protein